MSTIRYPTIALTVSLAASLLPATAANLFEGNEAIPSDAIVLFDGKDLSKWTGGGSEDRGGWKIENGYAVAGGGSIYTKQKFKDCQLHVEFWLPLMAGEQGQGRANSGVFLQDAYEVQILDSYGLRSNGGDCGAIYSISAPMVNACRPPEHWQSFDIFLRAARFDANGKKVASARMSVLHNGVWIQENVEVPRPTPGGGDGPKDPGSVQLQDHGCPIRFRNIWLRPL